MGCLGIKIIFLPHRNARDGTWCLQKALAFWQQNCGSGSYSVCSPTQRCRPPLCPSMRWTGSDLLFPASILHFPEFCLTNIKTLLQFIGVILNSKSVHQFARSLPNQAGKTRTVSSRLWFSDRFGFPETVRIHDVEDRTLGVTEFKAPSSTSSPRFYSLVHIDEKEQASPKEEEKEGR